LKKVKSYKTNHIVLKSFPSSAQ